MTEALKKRLETLKKEKKIVTDNYTTIHSYSKLSLLGFCKMESVERDNGYKADLYTITLK